MKSGTQDGKEKETLLSGKRGQSHACSLQQRRYLREKPDSIPDFMQEERPGYRYIG